MKVNRFSIDLNAYCGKIHCIDNFAKILRISVLPPAHTSLVWKPDARNVCPCIQKRDESHLDMYEGYNLKGYCYYNKEQIPVKMDDGSTLTGMVYIMDSRMDFGNPSKNYYDIVRQGYEDCGLDTNVLDHAVNDSMDLAQQRMECEGMRFF